MPPISIISSMATRNILTELLATWKRENGAEVNLLSIGGVDAAKRVRTGEAFDLAVLAGEALEQLANDGFVVPHTITGLARSPAAVAVRAGTARPASCDAAAIRDLVTRSPVICVSTGPSGKHVRTLLQRWGIQEPEHRVIEAPTGVPVARVLARGEADVGFQQLSELIGEPGIEIVGAAPANVLPLTLFSMGRCRTSSNIDGADAFMRYLAARGADGAKRRQGMEPA